MEILNGPMNHLSALLVHRKAKKPLIKPLVFYRLFTIDSNNISLVDFRGKYFFPHDPGKYSNKTMNHLSAFFCFIGRQKRLL